MNIWIRVEDDGGVFVTHDAGQAVEVTLAWYDQPPTAVAVPSDVETEIPA